MLIAIRGNIIDGLSFHGPYDTFSQALDDQMGKFAKIVNLVPPNNKFYNADMSEVAAVSFNLEDDDAS